MTKTRKHPMMGQKFFRGGGGKRAFGGAKIY